MIRAVVEHDKAMTEGLREHMKEVEAKINSLLVEGTRDRAAAYVIGELLMLCDTLVDRSTSAHLFLLKKLRELDVSDRSQDS